MAKKPKTNQELVDEIRDLLDKLENNIWEEKENSSDDDFENDEEDEEEDEYDN